MGEDSNSSKNFKQRLYRLPELGINHDCEFIVGSEKTVFEGHKFLFALASDVFQAMFFGELKEGKSVRIEDLDPEGFESMKQFIYTGKVSLTSVKHALSTYLAAHKYLIYELRDVCVKYIEDKIQPDEILELYDCCKQKSISDFDALCCRMIEDRTDEVIGSKYFLTSKPYAIELILKSPSLKLQSEYEVFTNFERWALAEAERQNISHDKELMSSYFNDLKKYVRFLTMNAEQLTSRVAISLLLTDEEKRAISGCFLMNLDSKQLPKTLSPLVDRRQWKFLGVKVVFGRMRRRN